MKNFEVIKRSFGYNNDRSFREVAGLTFNVTDSQFYDSDENMIILTYEDMQSLFDPVVPDIIKLIEHQLREVRVKNGASINRIVLVGGFGDSPYLNQKLTAWCAENGNIQLMCPDKAQAAVVLGAALRGLEYIAPRGRRARAHYGFGCMLPFREGIDREEDHIVSSINGLKYCDGRVTWAIKQGEAIFSDTYRSDTLCVEYERDESLTCNTKLYQTTREGVKRMEDAELIGTISVLIPPNHNFGDAYKIQYVSALRKQVHTVDIEIQVIFGNRGENLTFRSLVNGAVVGSTKIDFA